MQGEIVMFCGKCGTQNPDTNAFCFKCGHPLPLSLRRENQSQEITRQSDTQNPIEEHRELDTLACGNSSGLKEPGSESNGAKTDVKNTGIFGIRETPEVDSKPPRSINEPTPAPIRSIKKPVLIVVVGIIIIGLLIGLFIFGGNRAEQQNMAVEKGENLEIIPSLSPSVVPSSPSIDSSNLQLVGNVFGFTDNKNNLNYIKVTIENSGNVPLDISRSVVSYMDKSTQWPDMQYSTLISNGIFEYPASSPKWGIVDTQDGNGVRHSGSAISAVLNKGDQANLVFGVPRTTLVNTNFQIVLQLSNGDNLKINRTVPSELRSINVIY